MADKPSGLRPPSKIGRPGCLQPPKPAIPPSSPLSSTNNSVVLTEDTDSFIIGDRVWVGGNKPGAIAYIGETQFAPGDWAGIVLDEPIGKNDGSVAGCRYFQCEPKRGIFSRLTRLTRKPLSNAQESPTNCSRGTLNKNISPSLNASTTSLASISSVSQKLQLGERVIVSSSQGSKMGVLRYMGQTDFAPGEWCGVELDDPVGKNDGSINDKRYFECRPNHGLFAPPNKVSRSPSNRKSTGVIHKPSGAALNSSLRSKAGSRESLASISSVATSVASKMTTASTSRLPKKSTLMSTSTPARKTAQELSKERQKEIEILRKERDIERERVTKAASQADEAEKKYAILQKEFAKYKEDTEKSNQEIKQKLDIIFDEKNALVSQLDEERRKSEDLLFRCEEESIKIDDVQVTISRYESKVKDLEKKLFEERERIIKLEKENTKLFETEEELIKLRSSNQTQANEENHQITKLQMSYETLKNDNEKLSKLINEKNKAIENYEVQLQKLNDQLNDQNTKIGAQEQLHRDLHEKLTNNKKMLDEKIIQCEKIQNECKVKTDEMEVSMQTLATSLVNFKEQSKNEIKNLIDEHQMTLKEKDELIKSKTLELKQEHHNLFISQEGVLEKLKEENSRQIKELSESFKLLLDTKNQDLEKTNAQLEKSIQDSKKIMIEFEDLKSAHSEKEKEKKIIYAELEDTRKKLNNSSDLYVKLQEEMTELKSCCDKQMKDLIQAKTILENRNDALTTEIQKLKEQLEISKQEMQNKLKEKDEHLKKLIDDSAQNTVHFSSVEKDLKQSLQNKDDETKQLSDKITELRDALTLSEETKTNLESELRMYETNIAEMNEKFTSSEEKISQLVNQKEKLELEIKNIVSTSVDSSDKLTKYSEDLREKEKELVESREREFELKKNIKVAETKISTLSQDLGNVNKIVDQLKGENEELKLKVSSELRERQNISEKLAASELLHKDVSNKYETLEEILQKQSLDLKETTKSLESAQEQKIELEKDIIEKTTKHEQKMRSFNEQIQGLNEKISDLEKQKSQILDDKKSKDIQLKKMESDLNIKTQYISELESTNELKNRKILELNENLEKLKVENDELKKSSSEINTKYNEVLLEVTILKSSNTNLESHMTLEIANLKQQLEDEKSTLDTALKESKNSIDELTKQLILSSESNSKLSTKCTELESLIATQEKQIQLLNDNLATEKNDCKNIQRELESIKKDFAMRNDEIELKDKELFSLKNSLQVSETNFVSLKEEFNSKLKIINSLEEELMKIKTSSETKANANAEEKEKKIDELNRKYSKDLACKDAIITKMSEEKEKILKSVHESELTRKGMEEKLQKYDEELKLKETTIEKNRMEEEKLKQVLKNYEEKQQKNNDLIDKYRIDMKTKDKNITELSEIKMELNEKLQNTMNQIEFLNNNIISLEESKKKLEFENKQLISKHDEAMMKLNIENEKFKNNDKDDLAINECSNKKNIESKSANGLELEQLKSEYEEAKGQINFLNSVIVDMQHKNEKLKSKVEVLEMGIPPQEADDYSHLIQKTLPPPRVFCDICDEFDLHDTDDCPKQAQDPDEQVHNPSKTKKVLAQRPYCETCEMFGHDTSACEDTETF
ncbi:restin homolog isoform X2 [Trichogramma pretiosum]|uniref:restin homolog isoform X2 n=1 Tax=Trichogramma pretiosum TaxID=7493 RepID=UPI0006C945DB|nr:restin homolog isoform X2 [Trichogramma pretiosum]